MQSNSTYDAIVVGSGPGGASVARDLAKAGKKVLILEWGPNDPLKGTIAQAGALIGMPGKGTLFTYGGLAMVRGITNGGSSVFYYATAFDPPYDTFKKYGVELEDEVAQVRAELPIAPLSDHLVGPMAKRIMESARSLGYNWNKLDKYCFQDKCRPNCDKCNLGCPHGAKWTSRFWIDEAMAAGATFTANARVSRVITDGSSAKGVVYSHKWAEHQAFAPLVVISAGGIGTPVILRASGISNCGDNYFYDPLICVYGTVPEKMGGKEFPMAAGAHISDEGYLMTDMTVPQVLYQAFAAEVGRFDRLHVHSRTLAIMVKAKDSLGGKLTNSGGVRKSLKDSDKQSLLKGYERAKGILKNAGATNLFKSWYVAAHPGGTAKIGEVVDSNLETKIKNLYVCDCAVIPEAWGLPPSLTLLALGRRLGKHLNARG